MYVLEKVKVVCDHEMVDGRHHEKVEEQHMMVVNKVEKSRGTGAVNVLHAADYRQMVVHDQGKVVGGHGLVEHVSEVVKLEHSAVDSHDKVVVGWY